MTIYQRDGYWYARAEGGWRNNDRIESEEMGPFSARPEPVAMWKETHDSDCGYGVAKFTRFEAGDKAFTLVEYRWLPYSGYSWHEVWEQFGDMTPPQLGEAYRWTGDGWEPIQHPMVVVSMEIEPSRKANFKEFTIKVKMPERWIPHFCSMLKYIEMLGAVGSSRYVTIYADGDGDFNPEFEFDIEFEEVPPARDEDGNRVYDAG